MPDPITLAAIALAIFVGTAVLWHHIVDLFAKHIIPFCRRTFGNTVADTLASVIGWIDGKVVFARNTVAAGWRMFKEKVLGMKSVYRKTSATTATVETTAIMRTDGTTAKKVKVTEEEVSLDKLPDEVRRQLIGDPKTPVEVDLKDDMEKRVAKKAKEDGVLLDLELKG